MFSPGCFWSLSFPWCFLLLVCIFPPFFSRVSASLVSELRGISKSFLPFCFLFFFSLKAALYWVSKLQRSAITTVSVYSSWGCGSNTVLLVLFVSTIRADWKDLADRGKKERERVGWWSTVYYRTGRRYIHQQRLENTSDDPHADNRPPTRFAATTSKEKETTTKGKEIQRAQRRERKRLTFIGRTGQREWSRIRAGRRSEHLVRYLFS